ILSSSAADIAVRHGVGSTSGSFADSVPVARTSRGAARQRRTTRAKIGDFKRSRIEIPATDRAVATKQRQLCGHYTNGFRCYTVVRRSHCKAWTPSALGTSALTTFEWIIALLLGAVVLSALARKAKVPYPTFLAIGGVLLAFVPSSPSWTLEPELALA